jgi:hypothetical protein
MPQRFKAFGDNLVEAFFIWHMVVSGLPPESPSIRDLPAVQSRHLPNDIAPCAARQVVERSQTTELTAHEIPAAPPQRTCANRRSLAHLPRRRRSDRSTRRAASTESARHDPSAAVVDGSKRTFRGHVRDDLGALLTLRRARPRGLRRRAPPRPLVRFSPAEDRNRVAGVLRSGKCLTAHGPERRAH